MQLSRRTFLAASAAGAVWLAGADTGSAASALTRFRPRGSGGFDHGDFDSILAVAVKPDGNGYNRVDYAGLKPLAGRLDNYLAALQGATPSAMSRQAAQAYWINLYNAATLAVVLKRYPVSSIRDINLGGGLFSAGPWSRDLLRVEGEALSLDDIEHRIVRPVFGDAMSHYGLNCASYSCPNLMSRAYDGMTVAAMLRENATRYVNHPRGVRVDGQQIVASKIYDWYAGDFGGSNVLKAHWKRFAAKPLSAAITRGRIEGYRYDWRLNGLAS